MDCKVLDEEEKKHLTKNKSSSGCHNLFLIHAHPLGFDYDRDANSMEIEECIFGDNLCKRIVCFFVNV